MKKFILPKKALWLVGACAVAMVSCYTIKSIEMPHEINAGEEFSIRATIISNQGANKSSGDYGLFGIRVPEDWDVSIPENVLEHYTKEGTCDATYKGVPNQIVTDVLNYRYPLAGYKWVAYSTGLDGDPKLNLSFDGDDMDYYVVNMKVKAGDKTGDYNLDFVFGDEEEAFAKYAQNMDHNPNQDPRLFETGTFVPDPTKENGKKDDGTLAPSVRNSVTTLDTSIKVKDGAGVATLAADAFEVRGGNDGCIHVVATGADAMNAIVTVYNAYGVQLDMKALSQGETSLRAQKGACMVQVLKGGSKSVKKIFVK